MNVKHALNKKGFTALLLGAIVLASSCKKDDTTIDSAFDSTLDSTSVKTESMTMATSSLNNSLIFNNSFEAPDALSNIYLERATTNSLSRSSEQARTGTYSAKFILNKSDANVGGSKRTEAVLEWVTPPKYERWYGMSMFLPNSYIADPAEEQLFQWHSQGSVDLDGVSTLNSPMAMYTKNGRWEFGMKYGGKTDLGAYEKNAWTDWVIHVKWSHESDGLVEIWKNGKLVLQKKGRNNYREQKGHFFKIGVYKYGWAQGYTSNTTSRTLYYDDVKMGNENSSYAAVAPQSNGTTPAPITPESPTSSSVVLAVNAGGPSFKASNGITYAADKNYSGGSTFSVTSAIANTTDDLLYQTERFGNFSYSIPVPNGTYDITLKMAELFHKTANARKFDLSVEGKEVISDLDIFRQVGSLAKYDVVKTITITDGVLNIKSNSDIDNAKLSAFHLVKSSSATTPTPTNPVVFAINAGGGAFKASNGITYQADKNFSGGRTSKTGSYISRTSDDALYQSERYGNFTYNIPVANGTYEVTYRFAEIYHNAAGKRRFDVLTEGFETIGNLDLYNQTGKNDAYDVVKTVTVNDGTLNIQFRTDIDNAKLSAMHIIKK